MLFFGFGLLSLFLAGFDHDGCYLDNKAEDDHHGSCHETTAVEHSGVEGVGIVAAAATEEERTKVERAVRFGLDAMDGRE